MSGQPWFTSTTSGASSPEIASFVSVFRVPRLRWTRSIVTFGYFCSNCAFSWSQIRLTAPLSWSQTVRVIGPCSVMPGVAGAGGAEAGAVVLPGVQAIASAAATTAETRDRIDRPTARAVTPADPMLDWRHSQDRWSVPGCSRSGSVYHAAHVGDPRRGAPRPPPAPVPPGPGGPRRRDRPGRSSRGLPAAARTRARPAFRREPGDAPTGPGRARAGRPRHPDRRAVGGRSAPDRRTAERADELLGDGRLPRAVPRGPDPARRGPTGVDRRGRGARPRPGRGVVRARAAAVDGRRPDPDRPDPDPARDRTRDRRDRPGLPLALHDPRGSVRGPPHAGEALGRGDRGRQAAGPAPRARTGRAGPAVRTGHGGPDGPPGRAVRDGLPRRPLPAAHHPGAGDLAGLHPDLAHVVPVAQGGGRLRCPRARGGRHRGLGRPRQA